MTKLNVTFPKPRTELERDVIEWFENQAQNYDGDAHVIANDLFHGGCAAGTVGHLIYYSDTLPYYEKHKAEITGLLYENMEDCGVKSPGELLRSWDAEDPLALETQNQNLLAWFGFEETARRLCNEAGIDV